MYLECGETAYDHIRVLFWTLNSPHVVDQLELVMKPWVVEALSWRSVERVQGY